MKKILFTIIVNVYSIIAFPQNSNSYCIEDVQGIWNIETNIHWPETYDYKGGRYYIFKGNKMLELDTYKFDYFHTRVFGFNDNVHNDSIKNCGNHIVEKDNKGIIQKYIFDLTPKEYIYISYYEAHFCENAWKDQRLLKSLFEHGVSDSINYARDFLDYDICVTTTLCQLLDSMQNSTNFVIDKDEIVIVRNVEGDLLQVEYEDEPEHFVTGYIRRENLRFVVEKEDK